ncbi:hypothetical protein [Pseudomonas sp. GL-B-19]|uniref:hypothetical protein n=1 Tax=Pseudomonas sp. GL-B-19 TaxID=2832393 RepID=UPI001CBAEE72|nr:hypothetical protein [Pseudomonas sp. GL-B-19]
MPAVGGSTITIPVQAGAEKPPFVETVISDSSQPSACEALIAPESNKPTSQKMLLQKGVYQTVLYTNRRI